MGSRAISIVLIMLALAGMVFAVNVIHVKPAIGTDLPSSAVLSKGSVANSSTLIPPSSVRPEDETSLPSSSIETGTIMPSNVSFAHNNDRQLLSSSTWEALDGMELEVKTTAPSRVQIDFNCQINDRVSPELYAGIIHFRLLRDGETIATRDVNIYQRGYYSDYVVPITCVDAPESGNHIYSVEYSVYLPGFMGYAEGRSLRASEIPGH